MASRGNQSNKGKGKAAAAGAEGARQGAGLDEPGLKVVELSESLPVGEDAERGVLELCLAHPRQGMMRVLERCGPKLAEELFYIPGNRVLWAELGVMLESGGSGSLAEINVVTVMEHLRSRGKLDAVGGAARVADLSTSSAEWSRSFVGSMMDGFLEILVRKWQQRMVYGVGNALREVGSGRYDGDVPGFVSGVMDGVRKLTEARDRALGVFRGGGLVGAEGARSAPEGVRMIRAGRREMEWAPVWVLCEGDAEAQGKTRERMAALVGESMVMGLAELEDLWLDEGSGIRGALSGAWVVLVWSGLGLDGLGGGLPSPEVLGGMRLVRDVVGKVTTLPVGERWGGRSDLGEVLVELAGTGLDGLGLKRMLWGEAENGRLSRELWYEGFWSEGPRGGLVVHEDALSRRMVSRERLLWAGGDFWRWGVPDGSRGTAGVWSRLRLSELSAENLVREVLRMDARPAREGITQRGVRSVVSLMKSCRFAEADEFNQGDGMWINTRSGMLHALSREVRPHGEGYLSTVQIPVSYEEGARCDRWLEWLEGRLPDGEVRRQLQEIFGYCVVPAVNYHKFFFWYGDGGTGKSTATRVLEWLVGLENRVSVQPEDLDSETIRASLVGKTLYVCPEVTPRSFRHIDVIKAIVGGDPIQVRKLYQDPFSFTPKGRLLMTSNVVACTNDVTEGFGRRFMQMNWEQVIPESEKVFGFEEQVLKPEIGGILLWALEGFARLHERGRFEHTVASQRHLDELMMNRDQAVFFLRQSGWVETLDRWEDGQEVTLSDLWEAFSEWCESSGVKRFTDDPNSFSRSAGQRWKELNVRRKRAWRVNGMGDRYKETVFRGLVLKRRGDEVEEEDLENLAMGG